MANFIPEIWSAKIMVDLQKSLVFGQDGVVNRDYEGEISGQGDTVRIKSIGHPTIATYTKNSTTITPEVLTDVQRALYIDQSKYFAFEVDDIDQAQGTGGDLDKGLQNGVYGLRDTADQYIAALYTGAASANQLGTVAVTTAALAYTQLRKLSVKLDEANVPEEGRWAIVPPWYYGLLLEDDRFVRVDASGGTMGLRNGKVGEVLGFNVMKSNNAPFVTGDDYAVIAGHPMAISYAEQIVKVEAYRPESSFSDAIKGLHVYGAKLLRPTALATCVASQT